MPKPIRIKFIDTAHDVCWTEAGAIVTLFDNSDRVVFKAAFDEADELLAHLDLVRDSEPTRTDHRRIYDYAVKHGHIIEPDAKTIAKENS